MKKKITFLISFGIILLISTNLSGQNWTLVQQLGATDQVPADNLGISTAISDSFMIAGAWWSEGNNGPSSSGAAYIYKLQSDNTWMEFQKLVSPNPESLGYYGYEVAISGHDILVGAYNEDHSGHGNAGRVYSYYFNEDSEWILSDSIKVNNPENADYFGYDISMTKEYAVIGAYRHPWDENDSNQIDEAGAAFIYKKNSIHEWELVNKLTPTDRSKDDKFGRHVAVDEKGIVISSFNKDLSFSIFRSGAAYSYHCNEACEFENINSSDLIKIENPDPHSFDSFGIGLAISGNWMAIGKPIESYQPNGSIQGNTGAVYFYKWEDGNWILHQKVFASDYTGQSFFGETISMDGGICVIGASGEARDASGQNPFIRAGAVYVFEINENEEWIEVQKLVGVSRTFDDLLADEGLSIDGNKISVGAWLADSINGEYLIDGGAVYIFERDGDTPSFTSEYEKNNKVSIINNPSFGNLILQNLNDYPIEGRVDIYSVDGQKVYSDDIVLYEKAVLNVSNLGQNIYFVKIYNQKEQVLLKWVKM